MITLDLGAMEYYDEEKNQFMNENGGIVRFEYTLKTVYEWEAKWRKPFLKGGLTEEESIDFYRMMALDPVDVKFLTGNTAKILSEYIKDPNTVTTFSSAQDGQNGNNVPSKAKLYTSEEIYAAMFSAQIPLEFENRNLNRLLTILRIIAHNNNPPKKMNKNDILKQNAELNRQRKAQLKTRG